LRFEVVNMSSTEQSMGMSLEDMIKANRKDKAAQKKKTLKKTKAKQAVAKGKKGAAGAKKKTAAGTKPGTVKVVTIKKKIGKKGGKVVSTKVIKSPAGAGKKWKNDKFVADAAKPDSVGLKLFISNLDWGVTNKDLKELFGEYGALKSFNVHFNAQGKSQGTADVVFRNRSEALKAMKMYNGRTLDGRVMQIQALNDVNTAKPNDKKILSSGKVLGKSPKGRGRKGGSSAMDMS